jgi:hypothetical protein
MRVFGVISREILSFCHLGRGERRQPRRGAVCPIGEELGGEAGAGGGANQRGAEFAPKLQGLPGVLAAR